MATAANQLEPARRDWIRRRAALSLDECGPSNRITAKALDLREDTTSRMRNARRANPISRFFEIIWKLAVHARTTPWPILMEAESIAEQALMTGMDDHQLVRRFHELVREESRRQGGEDSATTDHLTGECNDLEALERAHLDEAALQREFAAVCRELRRREIDPRRPA